MSEQRVSKITRRPAIEIEAPVSIVAKVPTHLVWDPSIVGYKLCAGVGIEESASLVGKNPAERIASYEIFCHSCSNGFNVRKRY